MPNPWKEAKSSGFSRFVSSLRSKRGDSSPLVVQTGFPTSLADIVVKNRSRLRKPSARKKNQQQLQLPSPPPPSPTLNRDSFGCRVSEIISAVEEPEEELIVRSESCGRIDFVGGDRGIALNEIVRAESGELPGSDEIVEELKSDDPFVLDGAGEVKSSLRAAPRGEVSKNRDVQVPVPFQIPACRRVGFQAKVVLVMILTVCTKELVLGIMLSAFTLLLIESVGGRLYASKKSCIASQNSLDAAIGDDSSRRGQSNKFLSNRSGKSTASVLVSDLDSFRSERSWITEAEFDGRRAASSPERKDLAMTERRIETLKMGSETIKVKKKHWSKKVADKFRGGKRGKDPKELNSDLRSWGSHDRRDMDGVEIIKGPEGEESEEDDSDKDNNDEEETPRPQILDESVCVYRGQADSIAENVVRSEKVSSGQSCHLFVFIIVLSGLLGGRVVALVLTVTCCYIMKLPAILSRSRQIHADDTPAA